MRGASPSTQSRVMDALGALRDTIGAVSNLDQLLRSPKVGPKPLASVLPDVVAACPTLASEVRVATELLAQRFDPEVVHMLGAFLNSQVAELTHALDAAASQKRVISAGVRLGLEREIGRLQHNLSGALPLVELIAEIAFSSRVSLDLHELLVLFRDGDQSRGSRGSAVRAGVEKSSGPVTLLSSPKAMLTLIALSGALANEGKPQPALSLGLFRHEGAEGRRGQLTASATVPDEPRFHIVLPPVVAPTKPCIKAIALSMGLHFEHQDDKVSFSWREYTPR